jgi:hypothetical protein
MYKPPVLESELLPIEDSRKAGIYAHIEGSRVQQNTGADRLSRENPDTAFVPTYAIGHNTIYEWSCSAGRAVAPKRTIKLDR